MRLLSVLTIGAIIVMSPASNAVFGAEAADYWPTWRGHDSTGISETANPPLTWSETENIKWKVKLTGDGSNSSPIIWDDRIFFQTAVKTDVEVKRPASDAGEKPEGRRRFGGTPPTNVYKFNLLCLDRKNGKLIWQKTVREELPHEGHHGDHGFVSFSPVTDGRLIWANFGSRGVYCFDMDGNLKWSRDLGKMNTVMSFGEGGSLAVTGNAAILVRDHQGDSSIVVLNKETGETVWKKNRDEPTSWATPLVVDVDGKEQVVVSATNLMPTPNFNNALSNAICSLPSPEIIFTAVSIIFTLSFRDVSKSFISSGSILFLSIIIVSMLSLSRIWFLNSSLVIKKIFFHSWPSITF